MDIKYLIDYFAQASVKFTDVFTKRMEPGEVDVGRTTAPGKCGIIVPLEWNALCDGTRNNSACWSSNAN